MNKNVKIKSCCLKADELNRNNRIYPLKEVEKVYNNLKNNVIVKKTKYVQCLDCGEWLEVPVESKTERCDNCKMIHQREQTRLRVKKCRNKTM